MRQEVQITDPYPAKAKKVCEGFIDMYNYSASSVCVAHCLTSFEGTITQNTSCSERNVKRLNAHVWCYAVCGFVPDKGMPPGAAEVGWEMLLPDWWSHWGWPAVVRRYAPSPTGCNHTPIHAAKW